MTIRKTVKWSLLVIVVVAVAAGAWIGLRFVAVASAYKAKVACSCVLLAGRPLEQVQKEELADMSLIHTEVDAGRGLAKASLLGLGLLERVAVHIPGLGCTLAQGEDPARLAARGKALPPRTENPARDQPWPLGEGADPRPLPPEIDAARLTQAVDNAFLQDQAQRPINTRAVLVAYKGRIVAERYAEGFGPDTRQAGWSMTKSVMGALVGVLVGQGKLDPAAPAPVPAWRGADDPRKAVKLMDLLQMVSGLEWSEDYGDPFGDVLDLLFISPSAAGYAESKSLAHAPGTFWYYSSGTTNIISGIIRRTLGDDQAYWGFPRTALFDPLGMDSAVMETDADGNFVGSSFMFATARDWARLGLLYLNDGVWQGRRILPQGWVAMSRQPAKAAPLCQYGAQWWLNVGDPDNPENCRFPKIPHEVYMAQGHDGQQVAVIPSRQAVVVRLGFTPRPRYDIGALVRDVIDSLPAPKAGDAAKNRG